MRILGHQGPSGIQPLPYYGRIHAGEPALLPEHKVGALSFDRRFIASDDTFVLRVMGDSMIGRGIHDGDYVLVTPAAQFRDGDVVAARIGEDATIKSYERLVDGIVLHPANPADREIRLRPTDDYSLLGTVTGVFRPTVDRDAFQGAIPT